MEAVKNADGVDVYPSQAAAIIDDHSGKVFDDEQYKALSGRGAEETKEAAEAETENETEAKIDNPQAGALQDNKEAEESTEENAEPVVEENKTVEENKPSEEKEEEVKPVEVDYDKIVEEKTGGKIKKFDDLIAKATQEEKQYVNEESKRIHELLLQGEEGETAVHEYLSAKRLLSSIDKLTAEEVVKLRIQMENPDWTQKQVDEDFDLDYGLDINDDADVSDAQLAKMKAKQEKAIRLAAKDAQTFLDGLKKEIKLPEIKNEAAERLAAIEEEQKEFKKMSDDLISSIDKELSSIKELDFSFSDKDVQFDHKYAVSDKEKKQAAEEIKNYWETFKSSYYKDGKWQAKKMMEDRLFLANKDKIIKSAVTKARTKTKVETVKSIANSTTEKPVATPQDFSGDAVRKGFVDFIMR